MARTRADGAETETKRLSLSNSRLIDECRRGNEAAWDALIDKYKNLIYSIPLKWGIFADDAADIFQAVCLELLSELDHLRDPEALPAWLISVTYRKCIRFRREQARFSQSDPETGDLPEALDPEEPPDEAIHEFQRAQALRDSIAALPARCRQLVQLLFYENDPRPYREIAASLKIATGSIGFIRGRCLERLRKHLEKAGFK